MTLWILAFVLCVVCPFCLYEDAPEDTTYRDWLRQRLADQALADELAARASALAAMDAWLTR